MSAVSKEVLETPRTDAAWETGSKAEVYRVMCDLERELAEEKAEHRATLEHAAKEREEAERVLSDATQRLADVVRERDRVVRNTTEIAADRFLAEQRAKDSIAYAEGLKQELRVWIVRYNEIGRACTGNRFAPFDADAVLRDIDAALAKNPAHEAHCNAHPTSPLGEGICVCRPGEPRSKSPEIGKGK